MICRKKTVDSPRKTCFNSPAVRKTRRQKPIKNQMNVNPETLCRWNSGKVLQTSRGQRNLRTAEATPAFWQAWRANKAELQAVGVSAKPGKGGAWLAQWWQSLDYVAPEQTEAECKVETPAETVIREAITAIEGESHWSQEQISIFDWFHRGRGNLVVQARAGTGKTTTIKRAFAFATEQSCLYAVFNKKNQKEAAAKITDSRVEIKTLHALGFSYIKSVWPGAQPDDAVESDRVRQACPEIPDEAVTSVERLVAFAKNLCVTVPGVEELAEIASERGIFCGLQNDTGEDEFPVARLAAIAKRAMEIALEKDSAGRISFSDMVWLPVAKRFVRPRFDLVVVDECQDMNLPQLLMARQACKAGGRICVVGDDRQAIYGFRGAASDGMGRMKAELAAETLGLTTTYRCPRSVVKMAAEIVPDYKAAPEAPEGVIGNLSEGELLERIQIGDAILSRANAPLMPLCLALLRKGIPARIEGRDIGRQLLGTVKRLKARSVPDFLRKLEAWAGKQRQRLDCGKNAAAKVSAIDDQRDTLAAVAEGCANVGEIESRLLALFQDSDENARPCVCLSSVHKAKGLEWERVALLTWTFGRKATSDESRREEENIRYVALTRTKRELLLVSQGGHSPRQQKDGTASGAV